MSRIPHSLNATTLSRAVLLFTGAAFLTGCQSLSPFYTGYGARPIEKQHIDHVDELIDAVRGSVLKTSSNPVTVNAEAQAAFDACATGFTKPNATVNISAAATQKSKGKQAGSKTATPTTEVPSACVKLRNSAVATLVAASDEGCYTHLRSMYGNEAAWNLTLGSLTTLLTGSAAVVGSMTAKTNLAAAGAFFSSERALGNEVVYKNQIVPAIHQKILEKRRAEYDKILTHFSETETQLPFRAAMLSVIRYHNMCSFMEGLQWVLMEGIGSDANMKLATARNMLAQAQADALRAQNTKATPAELAAQNDRVVALANQVKTLELQVLGVSK